MLDFVYNVGIFVRLTYDFPAYLLMF